MKHLCMAVVILCLSSIAFADTIDDAIQQLSSPEEDVREEAVAFLGGRGDDRAFEPLLNALNDTSEDVREEAVRALSKLGKPEACPALIKILNDDSFGVRREAIKALELIGDDAAAEALEKLAATTSNPWTSDHAAKAAVKIRMRGTVNDFTGE
ncbi:MAG: HEAT repeat domain-containing protein [Candidatus Auribacter fodinae]|uniref:HEAT repeat domain-containing protein n=1 Tax=Candidatus Auribacter fodinae TaxID=2093366 RepID=A0A3A4RHE1_9BACT|nr:MAG: HEAT repeat domain-containing protein [Candidatus Auribacter fodinae]